MTVGVGATAGKRTVTAVTVVVTNATAVTTATRTTT
jgi:hypothetical protein